MIPYQSSVDTDYGDNNVAGNNILVAASAHISFNRKEEGRTRWPVTLREVKEVEDLVHFLSNMILLKG